MSRAKLPSRNIKKSEFESGLLPRPGLGGGHESPVVVDSAQAPPPPRGGPLAVPTAPAGYGGAGQAGLDDPVQPLPVRRTQVRLRDKPPFVVGGQFSRKQGGPREEGEPYPLIRAVDRGALGHDEFDEHDRI